jgi:menaquinone-dependent protoporphyrinogen oxidase
MTVLIAYASTHGHTAKIAERMAATLRAEGETVTQHRLDGHGDGPDPGAFDAVLVGASIHAGHHQKAVVEWAARNRTALGSAAFFSVCLTAADDTEESRVATRAYLDEFAECTGWTPARTTTFAGALQYREYDFATRLLMRLLMRKGGHPTDASRDYDYTDWNSVERFARESVAVTT